MTKRLGSKAKSYPYSVQADILLARVLELPPRQQLRIHEVLVEVLGEQHFGAETERAKQVRARSQAVQAIGRAAAYLGLPEGQAPSVDEVRSAAAAPEAEIGMGFNAIYGAFDNRWALARDYYEGVRIPLTAAQRRVQRTKRKEHTDPVTCLRLWWAETSPGLDARLVEYEEWAVERNERRAAGEKRVLEDTASFCKRLEVSWAEAIALASGEKTLDEARHATREARLKEGGPLLTHITVREALGMSSGALFESDMPNPVTRLYGQALWRTDDVRAYRDGARDFQHPPDAELGAWADEDYVASAFGVDVSLLRQRLSGECAEAYKQVPPPAGWLRLRVKRPYWLRDDIERWMEALRQRTSYGAPLAFKRVTIATPSR